jgi:hypothetical protein
VRSTAALLLLLLLLLYPTAAASADTASSKSKPRQHCSRCMLRFSKIEQGCVLCDVSSVQQAARLQRACSPSNAAAEVHLASLACNKHSRIICPCCCCSCQRLGHPELLFKVMALDLYDVCFWR